MDDVMAKADRQVKESQARADALPPKEAPSRGVALCLSGGGYRAMLFHVGALWRLNETGILHKIDRISSVSGGSIAAGVLGLNWKRLTFEDGISPDFAEWVVRPLRALASCSIDWPCILKGLFWFGSISERITAVYKKMLFGDATLQDLPADGPDFVFNATNLQSCSLWRFKRDYMRDWRVGEVKNPTIPLAQAVAASAAFPPVLAPIVLDLEPADYTPGSGQGLQEQPYTTRVTLADGGVYDNLGLEPVWKNYKTVLVSDGGKKTQPQRRPKRDWARGMFRVLNLIDNQVRSLRKRRLIGSYQTAGSEGREGTYWGIGTNFADYANCPPLYCPLEKTLELADVPTRLVRMPEKRQKRLINWGYAVCAAALDTHYPPKPPVAAQFPYPEIGV